MIVFTPVHPLGATALAVDPVRAKIIAMAGPILGAAKVAEAYDAVTASIRQQAGDGAAAKLKPVVIGLAAASGVAIFTSILAIVVAKRSK